MIRNKTSVRFDLFDRYKASKLCNVFLPVKLFAYYIRRALPNINPFPPFSANRRANEASCLWVLSNFKRGNLFNNPTTPPPANIITTHCIPGLGFVVPTLLAGVPTPQTGFFISCWGTCQHNIMAPRCEMSRYLLVPSFTFFLKSGQMSSVPMHMW